MILIQRCLYLRQTAAHFNRNKRQHPDDQSKQKRNIHTDNITWYPSDCDLFAGKKLSSMNRNFPENRESRWLVVVVYYNPRFPITG